jgi:hypothetical protein
MPGKIIILKDRGKIPRPMIILRRAGTRRKLS